MKNTPLLDLPMDVESFLADHLQGWAYQHAVAHPEYERLKREAQNLRERVELLLGDEADLMEQYCCAHASQEACFDLCYYLQGFRDCLRLYKTLEL